MAHVSFTTATKFLADQLQAGNSIRRVGVIVQLALDSAADVTKQLDDAFQNAWDSLDAAMDRKLAKYSDENQRAAIRFSYAGSLRLPVAEQLRMLEAGKHSEAVTTAAANQWKVAPEVQRYLVGECFCHKQAMTGLARNHHVDFNTIGSLANHTDQDVRLTLAANLGPKMRIDDASTNATKQTVYNSLVNNYESDFAPYLVPVCRDEEQLEQMYSRTTKTPGMIRLFVENPFLSDRVLLDISSAMSLRMIPGGSAVASEAKQQLEKRLLVESNAAPRPD